MTTGHMCENMCNTRHSNTRVLLPSCYVICDNIDYITMFYSNYSTTVGTTNVLVALLRVTSTYTWYRFSRYWQL